MTNWQLTWNGNVWTEDDLTGQHVALLALTYKDDSWAPLAKSPLDGPSDLMAYLSAFIAVSEGRDALEVQIEIASMPMETLVDAVSLRLPAPSGAAADLPAPV